MENALLYFYITKFLVLFKNKIGQTPHALNSLSKLVCFRKRLIKVRTARSSMATDLSSGSGKIPPERMFFDKTIYFM